jgi:site-specific recombinase XerD
MYRPPRDPATERLLVDFLAYQEAVVGLSQDSLRNHQSAVRNFAAWWRQQGGGDYGDVGVADIEAWLVAEADRGTRPRTRETRLYALRWWFRWLSRDATNPAELVGRPRIPPRTVKPYQPDEARRILATLAARDDLPASWPVDVTR